MFIGLVQRLLGGTRIVSGQYDCIRLGDVGPVMAEQEFRFMAAMESRDGAGTIAFFHC